MKVSRLAFLAAVFGACDYRNKPPILYVADTGGDQSQVTVEVDGFAREIYGRSEIAADQGGWWKVKPAQGQEFMIRPDGGAKQRTPAMGLRFADSKGDYRCLRLPPSGVPSAVLPLQDVPPAGEQEAPPSLEPSAPPPGMPSEGDAVKKEQ